MTDHEQQGTQIAEVAERLVPQLSERLGRHGLGEIEVAVGDLRLRVTARATPPTRGPSTAGAPKKHADRHGSESGDGSRAGSGPERRAVPVPSPAVGFFVYADGLGPGLEVAKGDALGHVEVLGVRHDVRAPRDGTVSHLVAESGEAVEYAQVVVEIEPREGAAR